MRYRRGIAAVGIAGAVALAACVAASEWMERRARPAIYDDPSRVPGRTVAIVLGARVYRGGAPSAVLEDRLVVARELYAAGRVSRVLVSGDHAGRGYDEVNAMHRWLVARGVPSRDVFLDHAGLRTLDTMERARAVFRVRDAVVCTQRFHLPRALFLARRAGIDAVGLAADRRRYRSEYVNTGRELFARARAVLDAYALGTEARHLGEPIPIDGDAARTHDRATAATLRALGVPPDGGPLRPPRVAD